MAALVASPVVSPLGSPTGFPSRLQKKQSDTTALVDGLLTAWSEQQSRSASLDRQLHLEEPTSFPFPGLFDASHNAADIPCPEASPGADFSDYTSYDFDVLFDNFDQNALCSEYNYNETLQNISATNAFSDCMNMANAMFPEMACTENPTAHGTVIHTSAPSEETIHITLPSTNDDVLSLQHISFEFSPGNTQYATHGADTQRSSIASQAGTPLHGAAQTPFQFSPAQDFASPFTSLVSTPITPSTGFDLRVSTPLDPHYSNASSSRKRQRVQELQHNSKLQYRDKSGAVIGAEIILGHSKPVRQPYSESDKAMTKATRARGACETCRVNKKRCNRPDDPTYACCRNCLKSKVLSMPCFMAKIIDAQLFRDKPSPMHPRSGLRKTIFQSLTDIVRKPQRQRPIIVNLTQGLGSQLLVVLARYDPMPGESTHRTWKKDGQAYRIEMPAYCIANMEDTQRHMLEYIASFRSSFLKHVLGRSNDITRGLFDQAQRFAAFNPESTVSKALDLCAASRIIERDWRICGGPPDLGIPLVSDDPKNPFFDFVPITPMMDAQLDQIVIRSFLRPTRDALLKSLQDRMTSSSNTSSFFEIFLTVAILLSHGEWLLTHSRQIALRVGAKTRYNYIPRAEGYFHACNTILAYWHHVCRGASLAELDWKNEATRKWAGLDGEQVQYLDDLKRRINGTESKSMMLRLRKENRYESELYWCHQLFFPNWKAGAKTVEDEVMTD